MQKMLSLLFTMLLAVCVCGCTGMVARPDRCSCEHEDIIAQEPVVEEPVPEPVHEVKQVIQQAVKEEKKEFRMSDLEKLSQETLFDFDSDVLKSENYSGLDIVAKFLRDNPNVSVTVEGHTDNVGSEKYNQGLSERRARTVANYLVNRGARKSQVSTKGFGYSRPVADNDTSEGRAQNRRTDLVFKVADQTAQ